MIWTIVLYLLALIIVGTLSVLSGNWHHFWLTAIGGLPLVGLSSFFTVMRSKTPRPLTLRASRLYDLFDRDRDARFRGEGRFGGC